MSKIVSVISAFVLLCQAFFAFFDPPVEKKDYDGVKNVIFMIGDGMGFNSINKTKLEKGLDQITMDTFTIRGESKTRSASSPVTDSAAGGSALATGVRTNNGYIGTYAFDAKPYYNHPMNLTELAISQGKLAGVITTDSTSGATPASFSAHSSDRGNEEDITADQMSGNLTVMWGTKTSSFSEDTMYSNGWDAVATDKASMDAINEGDRSWGQFSGELWHETQTNGMPTLAEMTVKAIDLLDDDEDGFFLMVEGAHIDKNNHNNNGAGMEDALLSFDAAIAAALEYAENDGETLVIVTADHETGGITLRNGEYVYTKTGHSGANVPVLVYGCDDFMEAGTVMKNCEVSRRVAFAMGAEHWPHRIICGEGC